MRLFARYMAISPEVELWYGFPLGTFKKIQENFKILN